MWFAALILAAVPPPSAATMAAYPAPADIPSEAIQYSLSSGAQIIVVPEELTMRLVPVTKMMPSCGMGWCVTHPLVPMTVGEKPVCDNYPTPMPAAESILRLTGVNADDVLYDLGCGDGRICIIATKEFGCRSVGLDVRAQAIELSQANARRSGVDDLSRFYELDAFKTDLSQGTVVYAYLKPDDMARIRLPANIRMAISFKHAWPGLQCEHIGEFYVWRRPPTISHKQPSIEAAQPCPT